MFVIYEIVITYFNCNQKANIYYKQSLLIFIRVLTEHFFHFKTERLRNINNRNLFRQKFTIHFDCISFCLFGLAILRSQKRSVNWSGCKKGGSFKLGSAKKFEREREYPFIFSTGRHLFWLFQLATLFLILT